MNNALRRAWRFIRSVATALGVALLVVTCTPVTSWYTGRLAGPWTDASGDVLVVLSGSGVSQGMLGESSYWRAYYAALAWREGGWRNVIVLGGGEPSTADNMKLFLEAAGLPASAILTETQSLSTRESALNVKPMLERLPGRKVLMTSDYHMFRAWRVFRKLGLNVTPRPIPDAGKRALAWNLRWGVFQELSVESVKIVYYYVRGWI